MQSSRLVASLCFASVLGTTGGPAWAGGGGGCAALPDWGSLKAALTRAITPASGPNRGLGFNMWGMIVATDGTVCAVAFSGASTTAQWFGSRVISAQKASAGNDFSLGHGSAPGGSSFPAGLALLHRQPLFGGAAGRKPLRAAAQQPRRHGGRVRRP